MGAQTPSSAPVAGAPTAGGAVPNGAHTYKVTYLYYDFEESNGSAASGVQTAGAGNNTIPLSSIPIGGYGVTARKIYRDDNDGVWLHLATISDNTTTVYSDTLAIGVTPTPIPTDNGTPPSFSLLALWVDRLFVAGVPGDPSTLFYSETSQPDIFTSAAQIECNQEDPITGLVVYFDRPIIFNRRSMGQILGKTSDTFRYAAIPSSVGCVDNRTIQIRVIEGVPVLIWLSDRGFYAYDGNSINYISENIEDLVNFNIQQAVQQKNSNTQSSQAQFSGGTSSNGINLTSIPGTITTRGYSSGTSAVGTNPRRNWDDVGDWDGGSVKTNLVIDTDNSIHTPLRAAPDVAVDGIATSPAIIDGSDIKLETINNSTGESIGPSTTALFYSPGGTRGHAKSFSRPFAGVLTSVTLSTYTIFLSGTQTYKIRLYNDSLGMPGSVIAESITFTASMGINTQTVSFSENLFGETTYWIGLERISGNADYSPIDSSFIDGTSKVKIAGDIWVTSNSNFVIPSMGPDSYIFCQSAISSTGEWVSDIYDSESDTIGATLTALLTGTYPSGSYCSGAYSTSSVFTIEGSDDLLFSTGPEVSEVVNDLNGSQALSISGKRYWRLRISLSTTDDRDTPIVSAPILKFDTTSIWESESIDTTSDVTTYNSLTTTSVIPAGTSVTTEIKTSADDITYPDGYVSFGSVVVRRYAKIRITITSDTDNSVSASVSSVILKWTLQANFQSSSIDTAIAPPAGFDLFLSDYSINGGTLQFQMRSASSLVLLASATYINVTPGAFPAVPPYQYVQWKAIITSSDEDVPEIDSVTVQWFISEDSSVRPASIFVDGRYYVALAELEESVNNVLLEFDLNGKWRRHDNLSISTLSYFYNRPYFGSSLGPDIHKFLSGSSDNGTDIMFDYRGKALDYSTDSVSNNVDKVKVVEEIILNGKNTGATFEVFYSVDQGQNFYPMLTNNGATSFTTTTDLTDFFYRLRPDWNSGNPISGRTIMYRIISEDEFPVEIKGYKVKSLLRKQSTVITG